jgi:NADP-dependent 3-hydroxy acid dehydrogenase YdfG
VGEVGIPAETFARLVAFVISEPGEVDITEILFRPTAPEL